ncbi:hypothetical protein V6S63_13480, partial [Lactococcus lactis]|uniref:hypothetical protein n=1 Tax=Lactococcus lactis TaxID=1358 RepID=UPI002FE44F01
MEVYKNFKLLSIKEQENIVGGSSKLLNQFWTGVGNVAGAITSAGMDAGWEKHISTARNILNNTRNLIIH